MSNNKKIYLQNLKQKCQKIVGKKRGISENRLTFAEIQNITKTFLKDRKAHQKNMGIISNIKGRTYCLELGEVSNFKDFQHYFYSTQYKRKFNPNNKLL